MIITFLVLVISGELIFIQKKREAYQQEQIILKKERAEEKKKAEALALKKEEEKRVALSYEVYPIPQKISYGKTSIVTNKGFKVAAEKGVSKENEEELLHILKAYQLKTDGNIPFRLVINTKILSDKEDSYQLEIKKNEIILQSKNQSGLYYGLQSFQQLLQKNPQEIYAGIIEDYADTKLRGIIEGYYGIPWTFDERKSLMNFMGKEKMNTFIFAPKNDLYHNEKWREAYPQEKLAELKDLVQYGKDHQIRLVWTIHPFMYQGMRFDGNYDADFQAIIQKFESLYAIGIRQFGVLADDILPTTNVIENQIRLMTDLEKWNTAKGDNEDLLFVPAAYNGVNAAPVPDIETFNTSLPQNVQMMWTGETVLGQLSEQGLASFQQLTKAPTEKARRPYFWLNWPTNDWNNARLFMGEGTMMKTDVVNGLPGLVTNPMPQGEASKIGIFQVADYAWHQQTFDATKSWQASFKFVEPTMPTDLQNVAQHLKAPMPNRYDLYPEESQNITPQLNAYTANFQAGTDVTKESQELIASMDQLATSIDALFAKASNKNLMTEITPWLTALKAKSLRIKNELESVTQLNLGNKEEARRLFQAGIQQRNSEKAQQVQNLDEKTNVEVGMIHLEPFAAMLEGYLQKQF